MNEKDVFSAQDFFFLKQKQEDADLTTDSLNLDQIEKSAIKQAIQKHYGNISKAADELGLTRASLYRRLEKHGIQ